MATLSFQTHLSFFSFFILILLTHAEAELNLDSSDLDAFLTIQKDLGITGQRHALSLPCNFPGLFCERRISNRYYVLRITRIVFNSQQLKGSLSPAIGKLTELRELSLPNNQLVDRIAPQLITCRKLEILNLRNNSFSGHVPSELSSLTRLRIIDFSSNKFSGNLNFLEHFPNLEKLSLANNSFSGKVPTSLKSFPKLKFFDFSGNNYLEGPIPKRIKYPASDLADRNDIPRRYVLQENNTTKSGNQSHSTAMAPKASRNSSDNSTHAPPPTKAHASHKHKKAKKARVWIFGFLAGTAAGSISGFVIAMLSRLMMDMIRGRVKNSGLVIFSPMIKKAKDLDFLEKEDGLASLELIGRGGCGEVYKAELPGSNGKMIAIKKIVQPPKDAADLTDEDSKLLNKKMRQIKSEIQTVGQIRHRNLVPLLAHVSRSDCHMLVYEFMKNGSLQDVLEQVSQGTRELDWPARHRIAMGVACGLEYLHLHSQRIIHRDLKPANILLDDDMEARIADFGLAKAIPEAQTHVTTSNVAGTVGYIAPEYHQTLKFTDKCDIYSYGVLLGALVIGKLPSDEFFQHTAEMSLVKWMRNVMTSDDPRRAIDPKLMGSGHEDQVLLVLKIAMFCTLDSPKERPSSKDIRCMLSQIKV